METRPLFVHCCHCRWCQRETGASFALNAMIESDRVTLLSGEPDIVDTPSESGLGAENCPLPALPDRTLEQLRRRRAVPEVRSRRHARPPRSPAAGHPHLHGIEAALGRPVRPAFPPWRNTTTGRNTGRPRASSGERHCCRRSRPTRQAGARRGAESTSSPRRYCFPASARCARITFWASSTQCRLMLNQTSAAHSALSVEPSPGGSPLTSPGR